MIGTAGKDKIDKKISLIIIPCAKTTNFQTQAGHGKAITYLKLREEGCDIQKAIKYCKINHCRSDVTMKKMGPKGFRVLEQHVSKDMASNIINGWLLNVPPDIIMGKNHIQNVKFVLHSDEQDDIQAKKLQKQQDSLKYDYKNQEQNLKKYLQDLNDLINLRGIGLQNLHEKLKQLSEKSPDLHIMMEKDGYQINDEYVFYELKKELFDKESELYPNPLGNYPTMVDDEFKNKCKKITVIKEKGPEEIVLNIDNFHGTFINQTETENKNLKRIQQEQFNQAQYLMRVDTQQKIQNKKLKKPNKSDKVQDKVGTRQSQMLRSSYSILAEQKLKELQLNNQELNLDSNEKKTNKLVNIIKNLQIEQRYQEQQKKQLGDQIKKQQFDNKISDFVAEHINKCFDVQPLYKARQNLLKQKEYSNGEQQAHNKNFLQNQNSLNQNEFQIQYQESQQFNAKQVFKKQSNMNSSKIGDQEQIEDQMKYSLSDLNKSDQQQENAENDLNDSDNFNLNDKDNFNVNTQNLNTLFKKQEEEKIKFNIRTLSTFDKKVYLQEQKMLNQRAKLERKNQLLFKKQFQQNQKQEQQPRLSRLSIIDKNISNNNDCLALKSNDNIMIQNDSILTYNFPSKKKISFSKHSASKTHSQVELEPLTSRIDQILNSENQKIIKNNSESNFLKNSVFQFNNCQINSQTNKNTNKVFSFNRNSFIQPSDLSNKLKGSLTQLKENTQQNNNIKSQKYIKTGNYEKDSNIIQMVQINDKSNKLQENFEENKNISKFDQNCKNDQLKSNNKQQQQNSKIRIECNLDQMYDSKQNIDNEQKSQKNNQQQLHSYQPQQQGENTYRQSKISAQKINESVHRQDRQERSSFNMNKNDTKSFSVDQSIEFVIFSRKHKIDFVLPMVNDLSGELRKNLSCINQKNLKVTNKTKNKEQVKSQKQQNVKNSKFKTFNKIHKLEMFPTASTINNKQFTKHNFPRYQSNKTSIKY
ncbi:hypothetical protein PPERSA_12994 [Pseudocohnilembus persalinus]|uniref:Uncharacterized protein n=1 Tax=Pseudocohnilembus persalinus TaxID=266149 RepID=A0A0V0R1Z9_PSEPJ|nr:hypothetical protein PPERSA_12994 [Pseudocohnilembus persalinus]|eukprot:KRX08513.1 hypothetical protein PPERSA_12994 [Pseudocohnilembus persalinus]